MNASSPSDSLSRSPFKARSFRCQYMQGADRSGRQASGAKGEGLDGTHRWHAAKTRAAGSTASDEDQFL